MIWTLAEVNKLATGQLYWYAGRYHSGRRIRKLRPAERTTFEQAKQDGRTAIWSAPAGGRPSWKKCGGHYHSALRKHHLTIRKQWC